MIPELGHFLLWLALGVSAGLGTMPLASPLCTPSESVRTSSTPPAMPRSDVVHQSCS